MPALPSTEHQRDVCVVCGSGWKLASTMQIKDVGDDGAAWDWTVGLWPHLFTWSTDAYPSFRSQPQWPCLISPWPVAPVIASPHFFFFKNFFDLILFIFLYSRFLLVINFIHISVYMSIPISQFIPPHPPPCRFPPLVSIHLFSTSVPQFLPWKPVHLYYFSRFHIYVLIYDICFSISDFTLYDSL